MNEEIRKLLKDLEEQEAGQTMRVKPCVPARFLELSCRKPRRSSACWPVAPAQSESSKSALPTDSSTIWLAASVAPSGGSVISIDQLPRNRNWRAKISRKPDSWNTSRTCLRRCHRNYRGAYGPVRFRVFRRRSNHRSSSFGSTAAQARASTFVVLSDNALCQSR